MEMDDEWFGLRLVVMSVVVMLLLGIADWLLW